MSKKKENYKYYLTYEKLYNSNKFNKLRKIINTVLGEICLSCNKTKKTSVSFINHPHKNAKLTFDLYNLQPICKTCYKKHPDTDFRSEDDINSLLDYCHQRRIKVDSIRTSLHIDRLSFKPYKSKKWVELYPDKGNKWSLSRHINKPIAKNKPKKGYIRSDIYASKKRKQVKDRLYWQSVEERFPVDVKKILELQKAKD